VGVADLAMRRPTLDDVFLSLTGHAAEQPGDEPSHDGRDGHGGSGGSGDRAPQPERAA
jgi:ABC-2 type transport system ATP-binding protein